MNTAGQLAALAGGALAALTAGQARAAGFATAEASVIAMGAGGTGAARGDEAGAAAYNPAAIAASPGFHASAGAVIAAPRLHAESPTWAADTEAGLSVPPHAHVAWAGEMFLAGASFSAPFGSRVLWPDAWQRRFDLQKASLTVLRASAFAGARIGPFAVAAGPFVDFGSLDITRAIDFIEAEGRTSLATRATGFGAHAGVFFRAGETIDLGLAYRSRSRLSLSGFADFDVPDELSASAPDQAVSTEIVLPDRFTLGLRWQMTPEVELFADLEVNLWSTVDALEIDFAEEATRDVRQPRDWRSTFVPRLGASWLAIEGWLTVRAGAFLDPSPTPRETAGPATPDSTRLGFTAGATVALPAGFELSLAYARLQLLGTTTPEDVRFSGSADLAGASLGVSL